MNLHAVYLSAPVGRAFSLQEVLRFGSLPTVWDAIEEQDRAQLGVPKRFPMGLA